MTNETEAPEMLPCPFCGGDNLEEDAIGRVSCTGCGATAPYGYHTMETWNTRADLSDAKDKRIAELADDLSLRTNLHGEACYLIDKLEAELAKAVHIASQLNLSATLNNRNRTYSDKAAVDHALAELTTTDPKKSGTNE